MSKIKSVKFNMLMNFILTSSSFLFPLISFPYVSRILQPEGMGKIALATSIVAYFSMFAMLGVPVYGIRACAKVRNDKEKLTRTVHELLIINAFTTFVTILLIIILLFFVPKFGQYKILILINSFGLVLNVLGVNWLYSALEQYSFITIRSIIFKVISIILMFVFIRAKSDYIIYAIITIFANAGSYIANIINLRKIIYVKSVGSYNIKQHIKPILMFFSLAIAINIYVNLGTVMLGFMKGDIEVGLYNSAVKVKIIMANVVTSLGNVLLPRMSYYVQLNKKDEFSKIASKTLNFTILISLPLTIFSIIYSREIILLLSGNNYIGAIPAMKIITPTIIFIGLTNFFGTQILVPLNREKQYLISSIIGAVVNIIFNLIFIPSMGVTGTAISTLIAEISVLIIQSIYLSDFIRIIFKDINFKYVFISGLSAFIPIYFIRSLYFLNSTFFALLIGAAVFFGVYMIILIVMREPLIMESIQVYYNKYKGRKYIN